jgi:CubicO group peptidase (beta-lactamase class C family)
VAAVSRNPGRLEVAAANLDAETLLEVGSITKIMTATLVLQHVERGELELDCPVRQYMPGLAREPRETSDLVTVRHLLAHTSGIDIADDFTDTGDGDDCVERYVAEAVRGARLLSEPGERWSYCNGGFVLLGRLVELLDGRPFDDALIERVFKPLRLSATTRARLGPGVTLAKGHRYDPARSSVVEEAGCMPRSAGPAGGVMATAADLVMFVDALLKRRALLAPELVEEMRRPQVAFRQGHQGLGWWLPGHRQAVHGGTTRGFSAVVAAVPGFGTFAVLANGPGAGAIAAKVRAQLLGGGGSPEPSQVRQGSEVRPELCAGRYERRHVVEEIVFDGAQLIATPSFHGPLAQLFPDPEPVALQPLGGGRFISKRDYQDSSEMWDFTDLSEDGAPTNLMTQRLHARTA